MSTFEDSRCTVGPNGSCPLECEGSARSSSRGRVHGDVEATQKITIRKDGSLVGNIRTMGIIDRR
jgi:cytoskeletal protein CcmA (bactofilin family)